MPDVLATNPLTGREYVIDCRIRWNTMSDRSDPLADVGRDTANDQQGGRAACRRW